MTYPQIVVLILLFVSTNSKSIGNSDKNVTKRETSEDLFPDWVPFKNKKGEQLGEFVQVEPKKPKKRLALPVNFILRAVAEPDGDDYYDKGQGESDGEDYFEKREWSDINRPPPTRATTVAPINHTEISDIDGVVGIIVKHHPSSEILKKTPISQEDSRSSESKEEEVKKAEIAKIKEKNNEQNLEEKKGKRYDDYSDYVDEGNVEKPKQEPTEEQKEAEARKAKILDAVDELKERHEQEQKAISEKMKEEAMHKEELERDFSSSVESGDKYSRKIEKRPDYEEYDDKENTSIEDKYKMYPLRRRTTTTTTTTTIRPTTKRRKDKKGRDSSESGKLSVFRNPSVYMIYDEDMYDSTAKTTQKPKLSSKTTMFIPDTPTTDRRFSSRYTTPAKEEAEDTERISLVPDDSELKEGEPTLFFPKKRKNKRKRKNKSTTYSPQLLDTHVAETIQKKSVQDETTTTPVNVTTVQMTDTTASDSKVSPTGTGPSAPSASGPSASGSGIGTTATSSEESSESQAPASVSTPSGPSAPSRTVPPTGGGSTEVTSSESGTSEKYQPLSAASLTSAVASDAEPAPSDHKKEEHKNEDYEHEKGGEHEHHSEYHSTHGESGKKAYEGTKSKLLMNRRLVQDRSKLKILKAKPWANTRIRRPIKGIMTKKIMSAPTTTTEASTSITTTKKSTLELTIMKSMEKNMQSMKKMESILKGTAQREAMTSIRKKSMRRKLSSLRRKETPWRKKNTEDTQKSVHMARADTLRRGTSTLATTTVRRVKPATFLKEDKGMHIRAIPSLAHTIAMASMGPREPKSMARRVVKNGFTTTDSRLRMRTSSS
ncbi:uncharacterized protein LOC126375457 isoform X2 [Pectinophora gossypiella]|uniref:uncharacterized protein LOC126375457 isoform X2 n=1 Tax=Pectinophora gossypiella TaxID=13191 RepID=UPI00214F2456|nr:uncharacterized protein LOC126375457 isoform X2 [Pectinophora gossypiella]